MTAIDVNAKWGKDGSLIAPRITVDADRPITEQLDTPENRETISELVKEALGIETMLIDAESFLSALKRVEHAVSRDEEASPVLRTVHVSHARCEATDNYRISRSSFGCEPCEGSFLVRIDELKVLAAWLAGVAGPIEVLIAEDRLTFQTGAARLTLPRFDGTFPNTTAIIPDGSAPIEIALSAAFLGDLKKLGKGALRLELWGNEQPVMFTLLEGETHVSELVMPARIPGLRQWGDPRYRKPDDEGDTEIDDDSGPLLDEAPLPDDTTTGGADLLEDDGSDLLPE